MGIFNTMGKQQHLSKARQNLKRCKKKKCIGLKRARFLSREVRPHPMHPLSYTTVLLTLLQEHNYLQVLSLFPQNANRQDLRNKINQTRKLPNVFYCISNVIREVLRMLSNISGGDFLLLAFLLLAVNYFHKNFYLRCLT